MVQKKARTISKLKGKSASNKRRRSAQSRSGNIRSKKSPYDEIWDDFVKKVDNAIRQSVTSSIGKTVAKFDHPKSVLKRMVYKFVRKHRLRHGLRHIETAIAQYPDDWVGPQVLFEDNPFHWVLYGLKDRVKIEGQFKITKWDVIRFGPHLGSGPIKMLAYVV